MPKKTITRRKKAAISEIEPEIISPIYDDVKPNKSRMKIIVVLVVVAIITGVLFFKRDLFLAATVNGAPILRWELSQRTVDRYGSQILDTLVAEKLILDEAGKQNISVSAAEITAKIAEIEKTFGPDVKIAEVLKFQGVSEAEFRNQVMVQALVDKLLSKEVSVSAQEVDQYLASNSAFLSASDPAAQRIEAEAALRNSRLTELFQAWFAKIREQAKVVKYL